MGHASVSLSNGVHCTYISSTTYGTLPSRHSAARLPLHGALGISFARQPTSMTAFLLSFTRNYGPKSAS